MLGGGGKAADQIDLCRPVSPLGSMCVCVGGGGEKRDMVGEKTSIYSRDTQTVLTLSLPPWS